MDKVKVILKDKASKSAYKCDGFLGIPLNEFDKEDLINICHIFYSDIKQQLENDKAEIDFFIKRHK